jgi:hypothetical protein
MSKDFSPEEHKAGLTLTVKPLDDPERPVDAEQFLEAATKWLTSLASFASDVGLQVRWEIAELRKSSAVLEVIPIHIQTGIVADSIAKDWNETVKEIESKGTSSRTVLPKTIRDLEQFASAANHLSITVGGNDASPTQLITVNTQKRLKEAVAALPLQEYSQEGSIRGNLAVLNSWNPDERWFRLRVPLAPDKQLRCVYADEDLIGSLGDTFEKAVDVSGTMHYRNGEIWPHRIDVRSIHKLVPMSLDEFLSSMNPIPLPAGVDSVSAIRSLRDGE